MRTAVRRAGLLLLAFSLSASAQPAPGTSTPPRDAAIRFLRAFGEGDATAAVAEWRESAATKMLRADLEQRFHARCLEIRSLDVLSVTEEKTTARVELLVSFVDRPRWSGRIRERTERHRVDLERDPSWKIVAWRTAEEDLLERMEAANDEAAAAALLARESQLIDEPLIEALVRHFDRAATLRRSAGMQFAARWMSRLAAQIDTPAAWAMAIPIIVEMARKPAIAREPLMARLREGIAFAETANDPDSLAHSLNMLGIFYMDEDESSGEAMSCYERALTLRDSLTRPRNLILTLQNAGACLFARQDYRHAYQRFQEALVYSRHTQRLAAAAFDELYLGRIYERENDPELAIEHYERGLRSEPWNSSEVMLHLGLSKAYRSRGNTQQSDQHLDLALSRATADHLPGLIGAALNAKSDAASLRGDAEGAAALAQQALVSARSAKYPPAEMDALLTQAWLDHRAGRFDEALRVLGDAAALSESADFPGAERYLTRLLAGRSQAGLGRMDEAIHSYREAIARIEEVRGNLTGDERESRLFFEPFETAYSEPVALLVERNEPEEAFRIAEQAKARVLLDALGGTRKQGDALPEADRREWTRRLEALQSANRKLIEAGQEERRKADEIALREEARRARTALDDLQVRLAVRYPRYGRARGGATLIEPAQLGELVANPDLALVEYVVQNAAIYAFVITRGANRTADIHVRRLPIGRTSLESTIDRYTGQLAARDLSYQRLSRRLHTLLIAPLEPWLRGRKVIGIAPAGPLWRLSFASLIGPDGRFLVEKQALFFVPSLSIYRQLAINAGVNATPRLVAFGDPMIGGAEVRTIENERGPRLSALPAAREEVEQIGRLYGRTSRVYTGAAASEERAKEQIGSADIVHFATHGLADDRSPMYSYILLVPGERGASEDGVLEAWEVMQLDLRAELVVLSACETARGRVSTGEGLVGLSWALFLAGCPSTAATLWSVRSTAAATEMIAFHRHRIASNGTAFRNARSLQAAQREAIRDVNTRHPFYWAAFVVLGRP